MDNCEKVSVKIGIGTNFILKVLDFFAIYKVKTV